MEELYNLARSFETHVKRIKKTHDITLGIEYETYSKEAQTIMDAFIFDGATILEGKSIENVDGKVVLPDLKFYIDSNEISVEAFKEIQDYIHDTHGSIRKA